MGDWLHCNTCFHQPGDGVKFCLTSCGHIYCEKCLQQVGNNCVMCNSTYNTITLSGQMKPDVEVYFTNPMNLLRKNLKQVVQVMEFQESHRKRFFSFLKDKLQKKHNYLEKAQEAIKQIEREAVKLKEENSYLRKMIYEQGHGNNNRNAIGRSCSPGCRVSPSTSPHERGLSSRGQGQHVTTNMHDTEGMMKAVNRISVRTPPSGGHIGGSRSSPCESRIPLTPKSVPHPIAFSSLETPSPSPR